MDFELLAVASFVYLLAGIVKGTVGIGLPTIVVSLLSMTVDPRWAMTVVILPIFATNFWQFVRADAPKQLALDYWPFMLMLVVLNYFVSLSSFAVDTHNILLALGVVVIIFATTNLMRQPPPLPMQWDKPAQLIAGSLAGVLGGLTTIWGPPMVVYLLSKRIDKEVFVLVSGAILTAGSLPLMLSYAQAGFLDQATLISSAILIIPAIVGMFLGEQIRKRINTERFVKLLLLVFLALGLNLIRRAIF
ncbi:MAG: sulfite exporter TauE/SafE family protein [Granulosicoccaceae bacterium]